MREDFRVLIVDDNPDDRILAARELRKGLPDIRITQIADNTELESAIRAGDFDLVVTDYHLGWTDGLAVLRLVRKEWPDKPVIMFTGTGSEEIAVEAMKSGMDDYVLKAPRHYGRLPAAVIAASAKARNRIYQRAVARISQALVTELELERVVAVVLEQGLKVLSVDAIGLWLVDGLRPELVLIAHRNLSDSMVEELRTIPFDAELLTGRVVATQDMQVIEDASAVDLPAQTRRLVERDGVASLIAAPLLSHSRLVGSLTTFAYTPRVYLPDDLGFLSTVTSLFAVALENARLFTELRQSLKLREEFMASAAHELRTPLTTIRGWNDLLLRSNNKDDRTRKGLEIMRTQVDRISQLLEDLLAVDRLRGGAGPLKIERLELTALVDEMAALTTTDLPNHTIRATYSELAVVLADRHLISEVIRRLLQNAAKYSPSGSEIEVHIQGLVSEVKVSVHDQGVGISPERQPHVFEPFYEPVPSGSAGYVGRVSLGLYLSKQIVEAHGGRLWFSSAENVGSTFSFTLPIDSSGHNRASASFR